VKSLIEAHQGDIFINSEPDKGTTVLIRFPAARTLLDKSQNLDDEKKKSA
ncbi:MAG: HAMP domain-containing histidine kinase, partial [Rhodospirillaceae bacterium]|nr:HAMP domain-containing histidine kinase [Rhodospirillaceae bacterium]